MGTSRPPVRALLGRITLAVCTAVASLTAATSAPVTAAEPVAAVEVLSQGREQQFDNFSGEVRAWCAPGQDFQELVLEGRQGESVGAWSVAGPLACDGRWHRLSYSSAPGFVARAAVLVSARLTVVDGGTGDPAPQAVDTGSVWVRPATAVRIDRRPTIRRGGSVVVHLLARCDRPWVESELGVGVSQREGFVFASGSLPTGTLRCDDTFHRLHVRTAANPEIRLGRALVSADLSVLDPLSFDPVASTSVSRFVRIVRRPLGSR